jgi:arginine decarboxylase
VTDWLSDAPLFNAWRDFVSADNTPFTIPGHKRNASSLHPELARLLDSDVPLYGGLDSVTLTAGALRNAERRGAELWGADWCRYSTGGSTHANQAICLALGQPGDTVLVSRTAHRSTLLGLVFAGLRPVWLPTQVDERFGIPSGLSVPAVQRALDDNPDAVGLLCVEPSYLGTVSDLPEIIEAAHRRSVPVVVDQAWGAHFGFAPGYPEHAVSLGADAVVLSAHKTLPAYSQASILFADLQRIDGDRLERAFDAAHTTSPAGSILASIDASRALLASNEGVTRLCEVARLVAEIRTAVRSAGVLSPGPVDFALGRFDPAKLVLLTAPAGRSGLDIQARLLEHGLPVEMADRDTVVPLISIADDERSVARLRHELDRALAPGTESTVARPVSAAELWRHTAPQVCTPREAFFAQHETVALPEAVGRTSAEVIAPYPPGIPLMMPGEQITAETLSALTSLLHAGSRIAYAADPSLNSVQVVSRQRPR